MIQLQTQYSSMQENHPQQTKSSSKSKHKTWQQCGHSSVSLSSRCYSSKTSILTSHRPIDNFIIPSQKHVCMYGSSSSSNNNNIISSSSQWQPMVFIVSNTVKTDSSNLSLKPQMQVNNQHFCWYKLQLQSNTHLIGHRF